MERNGDVDRAQIYHRYEIEARLRRPTTTPAERLTARLYKSCSDYGASIILPIFTLAGLFWLFGAIYLILAMLAGADIAPFRPATAYAADLLDAFSLSFKNAFLQLDGFGKITSEQMQALFGNGLISWIARFVGVIQTFFSIILAFLFGLAVRRKFQIR